MEIVSARVTRKLQFATVPKMNLTAFVQTFVHVLLTKLRFFLLVHDVLNGWDFVDAKHSACVKVTRLRIQMGIAYVLMENLW